MAFSLPSAAPLVRRTTDRFASATEGAAENSPANRLGSSTSPSSANATTNSPPFNAFTARTATSPINDFFPARQRHRRTVTATAASSRMSSGAVVALALAVFGWAVLSEWLARHNVTGPLVLVATGFVLGNPDWGIVTIDIQSSTIHALAEVTLALLLFADASKVPVRAARADLTVTSRLLGIGLPLTFLAGVGFAVVLYPSMPLAIAALIAASLAPTDAALSAAVIGDERLPIEVRRVLNVESGMNDGIATPVVTTCIGAAAALLHIAHPEHEAGLRAIGAIAIGVGIGGGVALVGGRLLVAAHARGWVQHGARRIGTIALALIAFVVATELDGNPFVAAF